VGAVGKTISLKTKAKIKGIKEKFDPLNIAKFMTFGSKIGPALYGKMMGRDQKDIDYFTGRLKHVRIADQKAVKLKGPAPSMPGGDMEGINGQVSKIYGFLKQTHEDNVRNSELSKNKEESIQNAKQRRHQELMDTLKKLTNSMGGGVVTMEPVDKKENFFDKIKNMVEEFLKDFDIKKYIPDIPWTKLLGVLRWFSGPIGLALLGINSAVMFAQWLKGWISTNVANGNQISPEEAVNMLRNGKEKDMAVYGGRAALMDIAQNGHMKADEILKRGDITEINAAGGTEFLQKVVSKGAMDVSNIPERTDTSDEAKQIAARPTKGGSALKSKQDKWDRDFGGRYDPVTGMKLEKVSQTPEEKAKMEQEQRNAPGVKKQALSEPLQTVEPPVAVPPEIKATPAPVVPSAKVSSLSNDNAELQLPSAQDKVAQAITNNVTKVDQGKGEQVGLRPSQIAVRNDCDTFMSMIVESTRIV
jgi:hypothetical protein